jgi:hypothetical protein
MAPYWAEHDAVGIGGPARAGALLRIEGTPPAWSAGQTLDDPAGHHDWVVRAGVRVDASDEQRRAVLDLLSIDRLG